MREQERSDDGAGNCRRRADDRWNTVSHVLTRGRAGRPARPTSIHC